MVTPVLVRSWGLLGFADIQNRRAWPSITNYLCSVCSLSSRRFRKTNLRTHTLTSLVSHCKSDRDFCTAINFASPHRELCTCADSVEPIFLRRTQRKRRGEYITRVSQYENACRKNPRPKVECMASLYVAGKARHRRLKQERELTSHCCAAISFEIQLPFMRAIPCIYPPAAACARERD